MFSNQQKLDFMAKLGLLPPSKRQGKRTVCRQMRLRSGLFLRVFDRSIEYRVISRCFNVLLLVFVITKHSGRLITWCGMWLNAPNLYLVSRFQNYFLDGRGKASCRCLSGLCYEFALKEPSNFVGTKSFSFCPRSFCDKSGSSEI